MSYPVSYTHLDVYKRQAFDGSNKTYSVKIENIKSKGFKYHSDKILYEEDIERERSDLWKIYKTLPFYYE